MERHRIGRAVLDKLRIRERFANYRLFVYGLDGIAAKGWFSSTASGAVSGIDAFNPATTDIPDGSYDVIVSSHALESVSDPRAVLCGIARLLSKEGFLYLAYANPGVRTKTEDWGAADPKQSGRYRVFGQDFEKEFEILIPDTIAIRVIGVDPVTGTSDICYLITKSPFWMRQISGSELDARILDLP